MEQSLISISLYAITDPKARSPLHYDLDNALLYQSQNIYGRTERVPSANTVSFHQHRARQRAVALARLFSWTQNSLANAHPHDPRHICGAGNLIA